MAEVLTWLWETVYERAKGFREYKWQLEMTVPAGMTVTASVRPPPNEVWIEYGYDFDVEALDIFEFCHYHDGREMYKDMRLGEKELTLMYTKPDITVDEFVVYIKNTDTVDRWIKLLAHYRRVPRKVYERLFQEALRR